MCVLRGGGARSGAVLLGLALVRACPGQWAWSIASTSIVSAARPALARALPPGVDARCRHREGVVDIVRGLLTPRGGYNARWCQQRASVPISHAECQQRASVRTTRAHANNSRRCSSARQRAAPIAPISTSSGQRRQRSPPRTGRTSTAACAGPPRPMSHTREGIRKHSAAHKGGIKPLCAAHVA